MLFCIALQNKMATFAENSFKTGPKCQWENGKQQTVRRKQHELFIYFQLIIYYIPVNPPPLHGSLPRKSLISRMDWVSCTGDINLLHTPFPPARSPPHQEFSTREKN